MKLTIRAKPFHRALLVVELSLWIAGFAAVGYYTAQFIRTQRFQAEQSRRLDLAVSNRGDKRVFPLAPPSGESSQFAVKANVVGRIRIAHLGISAIVVDGVEDKDLLRAVGHIPGTPFPGEFGNVALAGHRDTFFRSLRNIQIADKIDVTTRKGDFRYRVTATAVVSPEDLWVLRPTPDHALTLVTCYPFDFIGAAPKRFIVWAKPETA